MICWVMAIRPFCTVMTSIELNIVIKMVRQQNGLVYPTEVPSQSASPEWRYFKLTLKKSFRHPIATFYFLTGFLTKLVRLKNLLKGICQSYSTSLLNSWTFYLEQRLHCKEPFLTIQMHEKMFSAKPLDGQTVYLKDAINQPKSSLKKHPFHSISHYFFEK